MPSEQSKFSIVIPAYNCKQQLIRLLDNLKSQTYPKECYQILVIDDGSSDGTEKIKELYPDIDVVRHDKNLGRVQARETGAKEARYETIIFIDARLIVEPEMLENADKLNTLPLMGVGASDKHLSMIDRIFYLIRRRVYWPFEPQVKYGSELWLRPGEFDGRPKGTGLLIIDRKMFLDCALEEKGQDVNDDTKLLYRIVHEAAPILRHTDLMFTYEHRHEWGALLKHTFYRGPKFLDYYLSPGGPLWKVYLLFWVLLGVYGTLCVMNPMLMLVLPALLLIVWFGVAVYLSEDFVDPFVCLIFFPPIAIAFISGIGFAQLTRLFGVRKLIRH